MNMGPLKGIQGNIQGVYTIDACPLIEEKNSSDEYGLPIPKVIFFLYIDLQQKEGGYNW